MALHAWKRPSDPSVYGFLDVDATRALAWIEETRARTGVHVTITHLVGKAAAMALAARPDVNAIVRRGRGIWARDRIDVFFQIARDGGEDLLGALVKDADEKDPVAIATELDHLAKRVRAHRDPSLDVTSRLMERLPDALIGPAMRAAETLGYDLGLDLRRVGIPFDAFGSVMVTNVGTFGLTSALAPLVPFARTPLVITVGAIQDTPVAIDGRVEVRPVIELGVTLDHRILDGFQAGQLATRFREVIEDPSRALSA
ncbi:2-oxo acid dehydrogenase subunit E2 [Sandaracinus amylolyticus]|uniref:Dihydrolipoamide acetyltransferase n=1 Tax=Sandaracinus amylolyticus TaxID=927083 RepID=A0A0F6YL91_9BACT|nr:2-oxo acid dehydrogenase subunit E2 [Sandaracinus amylolyticus]AKF09057.1 Dihydrolipoamide acetyltransferase [Sandaracinus amylolyticus]